MFVVLGASGNTGKVVAETLLRQKKKVRVVLHDAAKGKAWGEAGADVADKDALGG
jgi:NAD(P)H dehydrogenase (quinone)